MSYTQQELESLFSKVIDLEQEQMNDDVDSNFSIYDIATPNEQFLLGLKQERSFIYQSL